MHYSERIDNHGGGFGTNVYKALAISKRYRLSEDERILIKTAEQAAYAANLETIRAILGEYGLHGKGSPCTRGIGRARRWPPLNRAGSLSSSSFDQRWRAKKASDSSPRACNTRTVHDQHNHYKCKRIIKKLSI